MNQKNVSLFLLYSFYLPINETVILNITYFYSIEKVFKHISKIPIVLVWIKDFKDEF